MRSPKCSKCPDSANPGGWFQLARGLGAGDVSNEKIWLDASRRARFLAPCSL